MRWLGTDGAKRTITFELITALFERESRTITTIQPFSGWGQVSPEVATTLAAVDRLVNNSAIFDRNVEVAGAVK